MADKTQERLQEATKVLVQHQDVSIALLQRRLVLGYQRALDLMEALAERGVVSAADSHGRRTLSAPFLRTQDERPRG